MAKREKITSFDRQLADLMQRLTLQSYQASPQVLQDLEQFTLQVASKTREGYVAVPLQELQNFDVNSLENLPVIGSPDDSEKPLIVSSTHAWLARYWSYEQRLSQVIKCLMAERPQYDLPTENKTLKQDLARYFPVQDEDCDWQKVAACMVLQNGFSIISGGPGTGKTTTITRILALLIQHLNIRPERIQLAAPTGKAAMRMQEAIQQAKQRLPLSSELIEQIPEQGLTLHRLLGYQPNRVDFRYNAQHQLPLDVLIVDEASMIDIAMMTQLLEAIPSQARVILLGDKDQLASVETGSVFRDLCSLLPDQQYNHFSTQQCQVLSEWSDTALPHNEAQHDRLHDHLVVLKKSYRFDHHSGIGQLAESIRDGQAKRMLAVLKDQQQYADLTWLAEPEALLAEHFLKPWKAYFDAVQRKDIHACFETFNHFRVLSPQRRSKRGTEQLNDYIEKLVKQQSRSSLFAEWYAGRPIMITQNDYRLNLFNGDVGITLADEQGNWRVYFPTQAESTEYHSFAPVRLPLHETAWAMTVHKSQGSEFDSVLLMMPEHVDNELLGRELFYTGVTRAKSTLKLVGSESVLKAALARVTPQASCIRERLL